MVLAEAFIIGLGTALLTAGVVIAAIFTWIVVTEVVRPVMKKKGAGKAIVVGKKEMRGLVASIRTSNMEDANGIANKLIEMLNSQQHMILYEVKNSYHVDALAAKDKSRNDFQYGGVIFENGGFTYDAYGARVRQVG